MKPYWLYTLGMVCLQGLEAQYITEVIDYTPAPGQFINAVPGGLPSSANSIIGGVNGLISLGAFGGQVIFRFEGPVENHPDNPYGVDFTIFGNPHTEWSEPGVVSVMKDENGNGIADDRWYELAGSDHYFSNTLREMSVTYFNPGAAQSADVPWSRQDGLTGFIRVNSAHSQPYYPSTDSFPSVDPGKLEVRGTLITGAVGEFHPPMLGSLPRAFGYADNRPRGIPPHTVPDNPYTLETEHSGGDAFDISWAVDSAGRQVDLDRIDFVRVTSSLLHEGGPLGELSTEICGAVDVDPLPGWEGPLKMLVIKDVPADLHQEEYLLEPKVFYMGLLAENQEVDWTCSEDWASVDGNNILKVKGTGPLVLTARVASDPTLQYTVNTMVTAGIPAGDRTPASQGCPVLYPNPAGDHVRISRAAGAKVTIRDASGRTVADMDPFPQGASIRVAGLPSGIYLVKVDSGTVSYQLTLIKL